MRIDMDSFGGDRGCSTAGVCGVTGARRMEGLRSQQEGNSAGKNKQRDLAQHFT